MSEPEAGSEIQAISTKSIRDGDDCVVNGQKMWLTNGLRAGICDDAREDRPVSDPPHKGMSMLIVEKTTGEEKPAPGLDAERTSRSWLQVGRDDRDDVL